jgi:predicted transport protein
MPQTPEEQTAKMVETLPKTTGKSMEQWLALTATSGKSKHGELVSWLKAEHGITHGFANLIAHYTLKSDAGSMIAEGGDLVAEMFAGDRAAMRPIFDALMARILTFGGDIEQAPKKGYLSLRRKTQFVTLHPSTKTRFDVGIKLKGVAPSGRLEAAGSWNAMVTHRVRLASVDEVDAEVVGWLRQAYDVAS